MTDVVHVSFTGGGIFLPNEGPADRQYLVDYVAHILHSKPKVQILRCEQRWLAEQSAVYCSCVSCGRATKSVCRETRNEAEAYCLRCALEKGARPAPPTGNTSRVRHLALAALGT